MKPRAYIYHRIVMAKLYIDNNYPERINLDNISDKACFSKFHFIRLFRYVYRKTPHQYLVYVRLKNSKNLLQRGFQVSEVCFMVGFESLSSFTGLFKKTIHVTPSAYGLAKRRREDAILRSPLRFIPHCFAETNGWENSNFQQSC